MKTLLTIPVTNASTDVVPEIPEPHVSGDSLLVIVPIIASALGFSIRELAKHHIDKMKAEMQAEIDEERALQQERTALIEDLRSHPEDADAGSPEPASCDGNVRATDRTAKIQSVDTQRSLHLKPPPEVFGEGLKEELLCKS